MIDSLDATVGRLRAKLEELKLSDRTLIVFTSDNGGRAPTTSNHPLRAGKGSYPKDDRALDSFGTSSSVCRLERHLTGRRHHPGGWVCMQIRASGVRKTVPSGVRAAELRPLRATRRTRRDVEQNSYAWPGFTLRRWRMAIPRSASVEPPSGP